MLLRSDQLFPLTRFELHDIPGHRACGHGERRSQIHLSRPASSWKVAVLRTDHDLVRAGRDSGAGVDAGAAARFDHVGAGFFENLQIAFTLAILASLL